MMRTLHKLQGALQKPLEELVKQQSKLYISTPKRKNSGGSGLLENTPPASVYGRGMAAKKAGEKNVEMDILKIYASDEDGYDRLKVARGERYAKAWWKQLKSRKNPALTNSMYARVTGGRVMQFDGGALHQRARDKRGGVLKEKKPRPIVANYSAVKGYISKTKKHVGRYVAGMKGAGSDLGAKFPTWVGRHPGGGRAKLKSNQKEIVMAITIDPPFAASEMRRRSHYILTYRQKAMIKALPYALRAAARKANIKAA